MNEPLVSIIIPTYNRAHLILETLESVSNQTFKNWECVIVDDGSTDDGIRVVEKYIKNDSRFILLKRPQEKLKGANACRNYGIQFSRGDFINFLDSDDLLDKNKLKFQLKDLVENKFNLSVCQWGFFKDKYELKDVKVGPPNFGNFRKMETYLDTLASNGVYFPPHAYIMSKDLLNNSGNWNEDLIINQDGEFFANVFTIANGICFTKDTSVYYRNRKETQNISSINHIDKARAAVESWIRIEQVYIAAFGRPTKLIYEAKKLLYNNLNQDFPFLNVEFIDFFNEVLPKRKSFLERLSNKFKRMMFKQFIL